jgi:endoglucanase
VSTGGNTSTGGNAGTGGNSQPPASVDCPDTSSYSNLIQAQYGGTFIPVDNVSGKNYYMTANWWGKYSNESESVTGVGFTMTNPTNAATTNNDPMGFPSIYIGAYSSHNTTGSNLPKLVSELTSVPTILSTNADTMGTSNYNAAYDVWMTSSNAVVTGSSPGTGGAYLMVWLFKPSDHQPRGTLRANGSVIDGVKGVWDVWYDNTNPPCVSYVSSDKISSLEFDLNYFIQDAVQNNYGVTSNQYLSVIFAGFEVWGGGDALQVKKFCANVK